MTHTIKTEHYGDVQVWKEVQHSYPSINIWAAAGTDVHGRGHRGYGGTAQAAITDLLKNIQQGRTDPPPSPIVVDGLAPKFRPLSDYQVEGTATGRFESPRPAYGMSKELPPQFWYMARHGQKVQAIKMLREITGLTLKAANDLVKEIAANAPRPVYAFGFEAASQPDDTVIRINGSLDSEEDPTPYGGYVFEKISRDNWQTAGNEDEFPDSRIDGLVKGQGYEILYLPKAAR